VDGGQVMIYPVKIIDSLPFVELKVWHQGKSLVLENVLVDTGSATTILKVDTVAELGIKAEPNDIIESVRGIGGSEYVCLKIVDALELGDLRIDNFETDIGPMDYGFKIDGIIGMDFLLRVKADLNLDDLEIRCK
jgi:predicted aspartyl protease